ncbi:peptidyl-prolyl cis-trans isomerase [Nitzschia inconspicua]|uniref:peptidylprolyl isomerase n=1 Tax=Nitzschia inconspicua TaxID=303405 RepID=A0A9K3PGE5_9STRA|nr:peptidyl-prolyl cis-trans isomerase [Nitzschia inconspicua]
MIELSVLCKRAVFFCCLLTIAVCFQPRTTIVLETRTHLSATIGRIANDTSSSEHAAKLPDRRDLLFTAASIGGIVGMGISLIPEPATAIDVRFKMGGSYILDTKADSSAESVWTETVDTPVPTLSSEYALLKVLPVKNPVFRTLEHNIENLSVLRYRESNKESVLGAWTKAEQSIDTAIKVLDNKRSQLEPVFNPDDSTEVAILKAERGEILIGDIRQDLESMKEAIQLKNFTYTLQKQRSALLNLGFLGELLVKQYPFTVPSKGKYSYLPRLLGRAQVTFHFKRAGSILGDVTIVADGYTAPITAGNFVDLCLRGFYTGLPMWEGIKRVGSYQTPTGVPINIFGSYNEGFYDPLTGKLRRIPLEIIRLEGKPKLSYSSRGFEFGESSNFDDANFSQAALTSKPLLSFETLGLIAFNHPANDPNGGSSEFFGLQTTNDTDVKRRALDGQYAPFGYIIEGGDVFDSLQSGDEIASTTVDDFGQLNLVKIRSSSFKEVAQGTEDAAADSKSE